MTTTLRDLASPSLASTLALVLVGCSSGAGGSGSPLGSYSGAGPAGSGNSAPTADSCVYQERNQDVCIDTSYSDWQVLCQDRPCSEVSWDLNFDQYGGDCFSQSQYQGQNDYPGTCDQWRAAGSHAGCSTASFESQVTPDCLACQAVSCCAEAQACNEGTECERLGSCILGCSQGTSCDGTPDGGTCACLTDCETNHQGGYAAANALGQCLTTNCAAVCGISSG